MSSNISIQLPRVPSSGGGSRLPHQFAGLSWGVSSLCLDRNSAVNTSASQRSAGEEDRLLPLGSGLRRLGGGAVSGSISPLSLPSAPPGGGSAPGQRRAWRARTACRRPSVLRCTRRLAPFSFQLLRWTFMFFESVMCLCVVWGDTSLAWGVTFNWFHMLDSRAGPARGVSEGQETERPGARAVSSLARPPPCQQAGCPPPCPGGALGPQGPCSSLGMQTPSPSSYPLDSPPLKSFVCAVLCL